MPYGSITDGVWRSKFKVEWRRHLTLNPTVREAQRLFSKSLAGQIISRINDDWTIKPIIFIDKYLIHPSLVISDKALDRLVDVFQRLRFIDSSCLKVRLSQVVLPRLHVHPPPQSKEPKSAPENRIFSLLVQKGVLRTKFKIARWRLSAISPPALTWSIFHAGLTRRLYGKLGVKNLSLADVVEFTKDHFLPKVLDCINGYDQPANAAWLETHANKHVISLLQGFKSVSAELYGASHTDNITYERVPVSLVYTSSYVRSDLAKGREIQTCADVNHLPSIIVEAVLRSYSNNAADSPVVSGPKTITLSLAICLLPNAHPNDAWPLFVSNITQAQIMIFRQVQDAMMTAIDQLRV